MPEKCSGIYLVGWLFFGSLLLINNSTSILWSECSLETMCKITVKVLVWVSYSSEYSSLLFLPYVHYNVSWQHSDNSFVFLELSLLPFSSHRSQELQQGL